MKHLIIMVCRALWCFFKNDHHLQLILPTRRFFLTEPQPIKEYTDDLPKTYKHNVLFDKMRGRIVITISGYYDVVSHVSFVKASPRDDVEDTIFVHEIVRENRRDGGSDKALETDVLARDVQAKKCSGRRENWRSDIACHTNTLCASFRLNQYDEVFVRVSRRDLLQLDGSTTHLGIRQIR